MPENAWNLFDKSRRLKNNLNFNNNDLDDIDYFEFIAKNKKRGRSLVDGENVVRISIQLQLLLHDSSVRK